MSAQQLRDWIDDCTKMERWVRFNTARRTWKWCRHLAAAELAKQCGGVAGESAEDV
jgi:hypothetical protein